MNYTELLKNSLKDEGRISAAYRVFHNSSMNNLMMIESQLEKAGIDIAPIATFNKWKSLGVKVKAGSKALSMLVPCTYMKEDEKTREKKKKTWFKEKKGWFALSQTDGTKDIAKEMQEATSWKLDQALAALKITLINFQHANGNVMGYATQKNEIAINPLNPMPHKTTFHEIGHIVLGHTKENECNDNTNLSRNIKELEAESVAYLCCSALELEGAVYSRGYIQGWFDGDEYPEKSAQRVISAVDKILKAGRAA